VLNRFAALAACALLLAGCWTGAPFYRQADTRPLLPPGEYQLVYPDPNREGEPVRVTILGDGFTRLAEPDDLGEAKVLGFTPLPDGAAVHIFWTVELGDGRHDPDSTFYGLIAAEGDGGYRLWIPACGDDMPAGASRIFTNECRFSDRFSLEAALARELVNMPLPARLVPVRVGR
jgi:hypothetical protein